MVAHTAHQRKASRQRKRREARAKDERTTDSPLRFDVRIAQLSVTMVRDPAIREFLAVTGNVRDALLYGGLPAQVAQGFDYLGLTDPVNLAMAITDAHMHGTLARFSHKCCAWG